eukprot:7658369-Pyramimonas_sp.AAC.2
MSVFQYADDLLKMLLSRVDERLADFAARSYLANACLDDALATIGCKQNRGKQEIAPAFAGSGRTAAAECLRSGALSLPAKHSVSDRYVGSQVAASSSFAPELRTTKAGCPGCA